VVHGITGAVVYGGAALLGATLTGLKLRRRT
jgi:hypothetical protein